MENVVGGGVRPRGPLLPRPDLANRSPDDDEEGDDLASTGSERPPQPKKPRTKKSGGTKPSSKYLPVTSSGYGRATAPPPRLGPSSRPSSRPSTPLAVERRPAKAAAGPPPLGRRSLPLAPSPARSLAGAASRRKSVGPSPSRGLRHGDGTLAGFEATAALEVRSRAPRPKPAATGGPPVAPGPRAPSSFANPSRAASPRAPSPSAAKRSHPPEIHPRASSASKEPRARPSVGDAGPRPRSPSPSRRAEFEGEPDADPTPVRLARRMTREFRGRRSSLLLAPVPFEGAASPLPAAEDGGRSLATLLRRDDDPDEGGAASEVAALSARIFSAAAGIDDARLGRLLSARGSDEAKRWELKKRLAATEEEGATLRVALRDLMEGRDALVRGAEGAERRLRRRLREVEREGEGAAEEKGKSEREAAEIKEEAARTKAERDALAARAEVLGDELAGAKDELEALRRRRTEDAVAAALAESERAEGAAREEGMRAELTAAREEAASQRRLAEVAEETRATVERAAEEAAARAREEREATAAEVAARREREDAVSRSMGLDVAPAAERGGATGDDPFLRAVEARTEEHRKDAAERDELERSLEGCMAELEKVEDDLRAAREAAAAKDEEAAALARDLEDARRSGEGREREAVEKLEAAEGRADAAEGELIRCREQLSFVEEDKGRFEEALAGAGYAAKLAEEAHSDATKEAEEQTAKVREENDTLKEEVEARKAKEAEARRLLGATEVESAEDGDGAERDSLLDAIRTRVERHEKDVAVKEELEKSLEGCMEELEKAEADHQSLQATLATKDRDLSELAKSVGDIQRAGQECQRKMADQLRGAEEQASAAEGHLTQCREDLSARERSARDLEEALAESREACAAREVEVADLRRELAESRGESAQSEAQLAAERDRRAEAEAREDAERLEREATVVKLEARLGEQSAAERRLRESTEELRRALEERIRAKEEEERARLAEVGDLKEAIAVLEAREASMKQSLSEQQSTLDESREEEMGRLKGKIADLKERLETQIRIVLDESVVTKAKVKELEETIRDLREERKRMHNIIQELRGNVRVFARIRPFVSDDGKQGDGDESPTPFVSEEGEDIITVTKPNDPNRRQKFSLDRVFPFSAGQEDVFGEVSEFVQSALDGYNVCLLSYGQTGSGKTHTMLGTGTSDMRGIIPRSIEQIAIHKVQMEEDGWNFSIEVSCLEIHKETIRDLLRQDPKQEKKHDIQEAKDGRRTVTNLTVKSIDICDHRAVQAVLTLAAKRRTTSSTDMNATSSRSHSVFTLNMTAKHRTKNQKVRGTLNLVDLAGSERLDRSNVRGQQAKESVSINQSLSSLADVFNAIAQKSSHVPFRNSKLTHLLHPALSGDGKTLMIVNISPTAESVQESLCSLRFASKVNKCELGKAKRSIEEVNVSGATRGNLGSKGGVASRNVRRKL